VKLVGEAGDRSHDEHHSADDTLPHVGSLLLLGNGLHESSSVESFLDILVRVKFSTVITFSAPERSFQSPDSLARTAASSEPGRPIWNGRRGKGTCSVS